MGSQPKTIAIVGAGIVGVSTAVWLLRDGHNVILIDRTGPGDGTSHGNGGVLASSAIVPVAVPGLIKKAPGMLFNPNQPLFIKWSYLPKLTPWLLRLLSTANDRGVRRRANALTAIIGDSLAEHQALSIGTDAEKWLVPSDYVYLYKDRTAFEKDHYEWNIRKEHGLDWNVLEGNALKAYDPIFEGDISFGAVLADHGRIADPGRYVKDLALYAERNGARIIIGKVEDVVCENREVRGVYVSGETIACDNVVIATGAWSRPLAKKLGIKVPMESERGYHLELWEPNFMPRSPVMIASGKFVATPMEGRIRLAGIVEFGGLNAPPSRAPFELLERNIKAAIPGLSWKQRVEWMGHRPSIADSTPLIGKVPNIQGAFVGFGHDHVGLTGGPKTGRILAHLISDHTPNMDLTAYCPGRFM